MQPREAAEAYLTFAAMAPEDGSAVTAQRRADELFRQVEPQLTEGWKSYLLGLSSLSLHRPQEAIARFEQFRIEQPSNANIENLLGRAYLELGQPEIAIQHFTTALKVNSNDPTALYQLGSSYELRGQSKMATDSWQKFIQQAPKSESAMLLNRRMVVR